MVATFIGVSIQDLKPNSQDTSAFYLANIYQILADVNVTLPPALATPPQFSPTSSAIWVNSLWFLSLVMGLTCALLATLLQQWARRYLWVTQPPCTPHRRARLRSYFAEGVDKSRLPWATEALPALLHCSLLLFFIGLVLFLFNIHHTVFTVVLAWVGSCASIYASITFMPIFRQDSPYYTPLTLSAWYIVNSLLYVLFGFLSWLERFHFYNYDTWRRFDDFKELYLRRLLKGVIRAAEETAQGLGSAIDGRALLWTLESLDEDVDLERFFAAIPGFCDSRRVVDPVGTFIRPNDKKISATLIQFMERTLSSNLISEPVKQPRIAICRMAVDAASLSASRQILDCVLLGTWNELLYSIDFALSARRWGISSSNPSIHFRAQCVVALVIAFIQGRDERWGNLAIDQLGISRSILEQYLAHGDSVLLANFICITQKIFLYHSENGDWTLFQGVSLRTLEMASRFDARRTLPELQHQFCNLWNRLVLTARNDNDHHTRSTTVRMLKRVRNIYIALHEGIDPTGLTLSKFPNDDPTPNLAPSYPLCNTHNHISTLTRLHQPEITAKTTEDTTQTPPVQLQGPESTFLASTSATVSQSPSATAVPSSSPLAQPPVFLTPDPSLAVHKLPSPSYPAPTPSDVMHHTDQHASSDSIAIPSDSAHVGSASVYPATTSFIPAPQTTSSSTPAYVMTARSTDLSTPAEAMSGLDQRKPSGSHIR